MPRKVLRDQRSSRMANPARLCAALAPVLCRRRPRGLATRSETISIAELDIPFLRSQEAFEKGGVPDSLAAASRRPCRRPSTWSSLPSLARHHARFAEGLTSSRSCGRGIAFEYSKQGPQGPSFAAPLGEADRHHGHARLFFLFALYFLSHGVAGHRREHPGRFVRFQAPCAPRLLGPW